MDHIWEKNMNKRVLFEQEIGEHHLEIYIYNTLEYNTWFDVICSLCV